MALQKNHHSNTNALSEFVMLPNAEIPISLKNQSGWLHDANFLILLLLGRSVVGMCIGYCFSYF